MIPTARRRYLARGYSRFVVEAMVVCTDADDEAAVAPPSALVLPKATWDGSLDDTKGLQEVIQAASAGEGVATAAGATVAGISAAPTPSGGVLALVAVSSGRGGVALGDAVSAVDEAGGALLPGFGLPDEGGASVTVSGDDPEVLILSADGEVVGPAARPEGAVAGVFAVGPEAAAAVVLVAGSGRPGPAVLLSRPQAPGPGWVAGAHAVVALRGGSSEIPGSADELLGAFAAAAGAGQEYDIDADAAGAGEGGGSGGAGSLATGEGAGEGLADDDGRDDDEEGKRGGERDGEDGASLLDGLEEAASGPGAPEAGVGEHWEGGGGEAAGGGWDPLAEEEQRLMEEEAAEEATAALEAERADLEARLEEAAADHDALTEDNRAMQRRALVYFLEKNDGAGRQGGAASAAASSADKEERYEEILSELRSVGQKLALAQDAFEGRAGRLHERLKSQRERLDLVRARLGEFQAEVCDKARHTVTGKGLPKADVRAWADEAATLRELVSAARHELEFNTMRLGRLERSVRAREDVGEGLSTIDFEQLKIENATVHEKIEDRQDELRKLRGKMTTTVQVLTHVREKLQFVQSEADALHAKAAAVEAEVAAQRAALAAAKRQREKQRQLIDSRKTARGFAHSDKLAIDFENRKTETASMRHELDDLKRRYAALQRRTKLASAGLHRTRQEADALGVGEAVDMALG